MKNLTLVLVAAVSIALALSVAFLEHFRIIPHTKSPTTTAFRRDAQRRTPSTMGLKVIGAGFGRTGTASLHLALNQLNQGPTQHMFHLTGEIVGQLHAVAKNGASPDWDQLLDGYNSAVDWPWSAFYKELMEKYPEAKVVLTVRDPEKWYASTMETVYGSSSRAPAGPFRDFVHAVVWDGVFDGRFEDKAYAIQKFNEHIEEVKKTVPADRLLVFEVKDGWEPLCSFLGVPVPDGPFPKTNTRENFGRR